MATVLHVAVGLAAARIHHGIACRGGSTPPPPRLALLAAAYVGLSLLPDADVAAFHFGIPYEAPFGHRGASHSLLVAAAAGAVAALVARIARAPRAPLTGALVGAVIGSHGLLDAVTDGGRGIALLWPLTDARYFAPWRPIPVAPIGVGFLSARGLRCVIVETAWSLPLLAWALWPRRHAR